MYMYAAALNINTCSRTPFSSPVLISGPFVSRAMAIFLSGTSSHALRTFSMVSLWYCDYRNTKSERGKT